MLGIVGQQRLRFPQQLPTDFNNEHPNQTGLARCRNPEIVQLTRNGKSHIEMNQFLVRLEAGVWLSDGDGDPPRTLLEDHAKRFNTHREAAQAIRDARAIRPFPFASVRTVPGFSGFKPRNQFSGLNPE